MWERLIGAITSDYGITIISAICVALLWQLTGWITGRLRTPLDLISSLANSGIVQSYRSFQAAAHDIDKSVSSTTEVRYVSLRGFPVTQETYAFHRSLQDNLSKLQSCPIRIMILDPEGAEARARAEIYSRLGPEQPETYLRQIREAISTIKDIGKDFRRFSLRVYDQAGAFRLLMLDDAAFVGFYSEDIRGATSTVIRLKRNSTLYKVFKYYFDRLWAHGTDV